MPGQSSCSNLCAQVERMGLASAIIVLKRSSAMSMTSPTAVGASWSSDPSMRSQPWAMSWRRSATRIKSSGVV